MRLKSLLLLCSLFSFSSLIGQSVRLTDQAEIAVMTLGPYQPELYSAFGHSAIRVSDPDNDLDWVFNYGVFDFDQENFYLNFAKGKMVYQLGMAKYEPFRDHYINEDRDVREQFLNLTLEEKQAFVEFLLENNRPANREYLYNYVYDNCASKIPEIASRIFPSRVQYDSSFMEEDKTIRDLMHDYLNYQPWGEWMIDIGLGVQIDKEANLKELMFLPDYVFKSFEKATIEIEGGNKPLVKRTETVYKKQNPPAENGWLTPMNFFILLFFGGGFITHINMKKGMRSAWLDALLFGFAGIVGCWLVFLWAGTLHLSKWNYDLLWAIPFHLPMLFFLHGKPKPWVRWYFKISGFWYAFGLLIWAILPEPLHMALVPLSLLMLLRSGYISYYLKKLR